MNAGHVASNVHYAMMVILGSIFPILVLRCWQF